MTSHRPLLATVLCVIFAAVSSPLEAQLWDRMTNPTTEVPVKHPPQIVLSGAKKLAVREFTGQAGAELSDRFIQALMESGEFEVVDRANLDAIVAEQGLQSSGYFSTDAAIRLGQLSGCGAIFTGRVTRCSVEASPLLNAGSKRRMVNGVRTEETVYARKVTARITASIQLVDLTTGKTHTGKMVEATKELINEAVGGPPEPPSPEEALSGAYQEAIKQLKHMILPWTETVELVVYDDNRASLARSAGQIRAGDFDAAVQTLEAVAGGEINPKDQKYMPKVYYNLGIALMYSGNPEKAVPILQKSLELRATDITSEAITAARKMIALKQEQVHKDEHAIRLDGPAEQLKPAAAKLTNSSVIEMAKAGVGDAIIITKIRKNPSGLDGSTEGIIALKKGGVSDAVIMVIGEVAPQ
jgi:tetratricopeptide (TPR) repeat protein